MVRVLAGGPARETDSALFKLHKDSLEAQAGAFEVAVRHEVVQDPGGARWNHSKIERVARVRQDFMDDARLRYGRSLLLVDTDVVLGPGVLQRLLEVKADVVYGVFWTWSDWGGREASWPQVWDINPYGWTEACAKALRTDGVNEVEVYGGGACTLIRGRGFESRYHPLLQSLQPYGNMWAGEDRSFCLGLETRGVKQVAVTGLDITHCYAVTHQTRPHIRKLRKRLGL